MFKRFAGLAAVFVCLIASSALAENAQPVVEFIATGGTIAIRAVQRSIHDAHGEDCFDAAEGEAMPRICDIAHIIEAQDVGGE
jgi:hypothetical protein